MPKRLNWIGLVGAIIIDTASPGFAQDISKSVAMGQNLAKTFCRDCHQISIEESKPRAHVPSFIEIAKLPTTTTLSIRAFMQIKHNEMPNYQLTRDQTENVIAFIMSLQK
jgi:mono/diheme cytochrome c family protein